MPDHVLQDSLWGEELRLERQSRAEGIARYRRMVSETMERGEGSGLRSVERLSQHWFEPLCRLIAAEKRACSSNKPGRRRRLTGPVLVQFTTARLAMATLHEVLSGVLAEYVGITPLRACLAIARNLNAQVNYRAMRTFQNQGQRAARAAGQNPWQYRHPQWDALVHTSRRRITVRATNRVAYRFEPSSRWPIGLQAKIGAVLLELLMRVATCRGYDEPFTPALEKHLGWGANGHNCYYLRLTEAGREIIAQGHRARELRRPAYLPMVVPPLHWTDCEPGGYAILPTVLLKKPARHGRAEAEPPEVREAVNAIGATPWRVNRWVLGILGQLAAGGGGDAGIPALVPLALPPLPAGSDEDAVVRYKRHAAWVYRRNHQIASEARVFAIKLDAAGLMKDYPRIYFPHQLDFRGRLYPVPVLFHHQGDDVCRGLLEFAEGRDCTGERAQFWLKVHLANRCGVDKVSFEQRVDWVEASRESFAGWVADPLVNTGWMDADDPFQALASARALLDPAAGAYLPCQIDGTNNALQHYAAMTRDEDAARMVNVLPGESPQDFYAEVAASVERRVGADAEAGHDIARQLDGYITRKVVKQTAMTNYYGVTMVGARRQMYGALEAAGFAERRLYPASKYFSRVVLECTERECPAVQAALVWLRACAKAIARSGHAVIWTSPIGLEVEQPYRNTRAQFVWTAFGRMCIQPRSDSSPVSPFKQVSAFAPNFVHSIDAAHLMSAALSAHDAGIRFGGVHDSLWTHAADMDRMGRIGREHFVLVHEEPLLEKLAVELRRRFKRVKLPDPPAPGGLDIAQAAESAYLFA